MTLIKTDKALAELSARQRTLNIKERALLLLADGRTPAATLLAQVRTTEDVLTRLVSAGFLVVSAPTSTSTAASASKPAQAAAPASNATGMSQATTVKAAPLEVEPPLPTPVAADRFDGQRSLATARMYLFDMAERMFARRTPELAEAIRNELREARDEEAMLEVAHRLLHIIEQTAGAERADAISERLTKLLPAHSLVIY